MNSIGDEIEESIRVKTLLKSQPGKIEEAALLMISSIKNGGKIILFGNGGSAADSQHIAAELVGKFMLKRQALPAIALTTNTSILTAIANDFSFEEVFSRQVEALARKNDIVIGITTSGRSQNVINALMTANKIGCTSIALTGGAGKHLSKVVDVCIAVPSVNTQRIQECHILIGHILCRLIEQQLTKGQEQVLKIQ